MGYAGYYDEMYAVQQQHGGYGGGYGADYYYPPPYQGVTAPTVPASNGYESKALPITNGGVGHGVSGKKTKSEKKSEEMPMSPGRRVNKIQKQLEYYFSSQNMDSDSFLRESMDGNGWVHIDVIMAFNRMNVLGATKELLVEAAFHSTNIEVDTKNPDRIRMHKLWKEYVRRNKEKKRKDERKRQKELDESELTKDTIEDIVALITKKDRRRKKRREVRKRQREKEEEKAKKKEKNGDDDTKEDEEQEKDDIGDPTHKDMVEID